MLTKDQMRMKYFLATHFERTRIIDPRIDQLVDKKETIHKIH